MNISDYRRFWLDLTLGALGGNRAHFDITDESGERRIEFDAYRQGLVTLVLMGFIESNFLNKDEVKKLRAFKTIDSLPKSVNQSQLSCFMFVRDCFAHSPFGELFLTGNNAKEFEKHLLDESFPYTKINNGRFVSVNTHQLHLIVLRLFGEYDE